jgi:hypothetical protein
MFRHVLFLLTVAVAVLTALPASAHFVIWRDPDFKTDITYPDTWRAQGGLPGEGRYKIVAPGNDAAQCILFNKTDRRYTIYPRDYVSDVLAQDMQWSYWEQAVASYDDLYFYYDNFGALNGGPARYTLVDYIDRTPEKRGQPAVRKRAWVYGAIAGDMHINVHCSANLDSFESYADTFAQIIDSVSFPAPYAATYNGDYRDVLRKHKRSTNIIGPLLVYIMPRAPFTRIIHCPKNGEYPACLFKPKQRQIPTR